MPPEVSIVICTCNRATQLPKALDALLAMQCETPWEAVILDNNSTDDTAAVIESYARRDQRIRPASETQQGLGAARDTAWRLARGDIISFTDDDCYVAPDYADRIREVFADHPEWSYAGGRILLHNPEDARITIDEREEVVEIASRSFLMAGVLQGANMSFRRSALEQIDGYSRNMGAGTPFPCEDIDALGRAAWHGLSGGFDPRPIISHDHGRKDADLASLWLSYDRGRAAYFARFLGRRDSNRAYRHGISEHFAMMPMGPALRKSAIYFFHGNKFLADAKMEHGLRFNLSLALVLAKTVAGKLIRKFQT